VITDDQNIWPLQTFAGQSSPTYLNAENLQIQEDAAVNSYDPVEEYKNAETPASSVLIEDFYDEPPQN